jgi:hypothetical protein
MFDTLHILILSLLVFLLLIDVYDNVGKLKIGILSYKLNIDIYIFFQKKNQPKEKDLSFYKRDKIFH